MNTYPTYSIERSSYVVEIEDGTVFERSENGTPHIQILFSELQYSFSLRHIMLPPSAQNVLTEFYTNNKTQYFIYKEPVTNYQYEVVFLAPPRVVERYVDRATYEIKFTGKRLL